MAKHTAGETPTEQDAAPQKDPPRSGTIPAAGFVLAGTYPEDDPIGGLEAAIEVIATAERLGYDTAGVRQRHLERGVSGAIPFLAAVSQRTSTITLETDVVPLGYEVPFRLAEDFGLLFALARGRLNIGISLSSPHADYLAQFARPDATGDFDRYEAGERFLRALASEPLDDTPIATPYGPAIPRIQPRIPGIVDRVWLGGGSNASVAWAARHGLKLLLGNITGVEGYPDFETAQRGRIDAYLADYTVQPGSEGRPAVGVERVLLPYDGADAARLAHYREYAASRVERTRAPQEVGGSRQFIQRDLAGPADEIIERLRADPVFDGTTELRISLPYGFSYDDYAHILGTVRERILPEVGWRPLR